MITKSFIEKISKNKDELFKNKEEVSKNEEEDILKTKVYSRDIPATFTILYGTEASALYFLSTDLHTNPLSLPLPSPPKH